MPQDSSPLRSLEVLNHEDYDFLDLGCSSGRSVGYAQRRFGGGRGLGVDLDERKLDQSVAAGVEVVRADATKLQLDKTVRFITMLDFLEHLPGLDIVETVLASAAQAATDFLFIKHPSFEGRQHAEAQGVRQYWWDWHGHTSHVQVADYCQMFDRLGLRQYMVRYLGRVEDSRHETVIPVTMPRDQSADEARQVTDKPLVHFEPPLWRRQDIFIALRSFEADEWRRITEPTGADLNLMGAEGRPAAPAPGMS